MAVWLEIPKEEITLTEIGQISERMDKFFLRYWDGESKPNYWQLEIRGGEDKYERDRQKIHKELYNQLEKLRNDKKVVLEAISQKNDSLKDFPFFQDDKEVVLTAVENYGFALDYTSDRLRDDKEIVLTAVKNDGRALAYASDELRDDKEIVLTAVKNYGLALEYASDELRDDKEIVLTAVKNYGLALEYASERLQKEILENQKQEKNSMNEKIESLIGIVANNKEDENVGHKVKLFNDLSDTDKVFFKENATNIAIERIEELQEGISNAEKESITAKFNTFFKQVEEAPKLNNEREQVLSYLKNQMMYLGFGQDKNLHNQLEKGIEEAKNGEKFQISTPYDKVQEGNTANFTINFHKSSENAVYLNSFKAVLKDGNTGEERTHLFGVNNFTAKEAINLLEGRAVKTQFTNKETQQKNDVFVRLKMNEPKNEFGNYQMQMFSKNYGINTADIVNKSQLVFSGENAEKIKDFVIKSLEKGNIVNVRFKDDNNKEMNGKAIFNPQYKTINLYDEQMNRVNTNKPIKGLEVDLQQDKNNVREQSRVRSHH